MIALDDLLRRLHGLEHAELVRWVENRWVLPERHGESWVFHELDVARVELIFDIRRDFAVDDDAMELILGLLDQVYGLRRQMRRLCDAVAAQPPEVQHTIRKLLPRASGPGSE
jgi:chaperone modulatory protein CbpM